MALSMYQNTRCLLPFVNGIATARKPVGISLTTFRNLSSFLKKRRPSRLPIYLSALGVAVGFGILATYSPTKSMEYSVVNKVIPCVKAIVPEDENDDEIDETNLKKRNKLSAQFNFIADAVESATPAVVYIQVCILSALLILEIMASNQINSNQIKFRYENLIGLEPACCMYSFICAQGSS